MSSIYDCQTIKQLKTFMYNVQAAPEQGNQFVYNGRNYITMEQMIGQLNHLTSNLKNAKEAKRAKKVLEKINALARVRVPNAGSEEVSKEGGILQLWTKLTDYTNYSSFFPSLPRFFSPSKEELLQAIEERINFSLATSDALLLPPSLRYDRAKIIQEITVAVKKSSVDSAAWQALLKEYPAQELFACGLPAKDILELYKTAPDLLSKIFHAGICLLPMSPISLERLKAFEFIFTFKKQIPEEYQPVLQWLFYPLGEKGFEPLIPFLLWCQQELSKGGEQQPLLEGIEKSIALYWKNMDFQRKCQEWFQQGKFQNVVDCLKDTSAIGDQNELEKSYIKHGLMQIRSEFITKQLQEWKEINPLLAPQATLWLSKYIAYQQERNQSIPTSWEGCLQEIKHMERAEQASLICKFRDFSHLREERQRIAVLEIGARFPFLISEISLAVKKLSVQNLEKLKDVVERYPCVAVDLITNKYCNLEKIFAEKERLSSEFGNKEGFDQWAKLVACLPSGNMGKKTLWEEYHRLYNRFPPAEYVVFFQERIDDDTFSLSNFESLQKEDPRSCQEIITRFSALGNEILSALFVGAARDIPQNSQSSEYHRQAKTVYQILNRGYSPEMVEILYNMADKSLQKKLFDYLMEPKAAEEQRNRGEYCKALLDIIRLSGTKNLDTIFSLLAQREPTPMSQAVKKLVLQREHEPLQAVMKLDEGVDVELLKSIGLNGMGGTNLQKLWEVTFKRPYPFPCKQPQLSTKPFICTQEIKGDGERLQLAKDMSSHLLLPDGAVDRSAIEPLKQALGTFALSQPVNAAMTIALESLQEDYELSLRLTRLAQLPPKGSSIDLLLHHMLGINESEQLSLQQVRWAVLSALLWPTRQGAAGSCFATGIVIQGEFYRQGIKQKMEDLCQMVETNALTRPATREDGKTEVIIDYPIFALDFLADPDYQNDHLLCRAREFTLSSMGAPDHHMRDDIGGEVDKFATILSQLLPGPGQDMIGRCRELLKSETEAQLEFVFLPSCKNPDTGELGAWSLCQRLSKKLISSQRDYRHAILSIVEKSILQLSQAFPAHEKELVESFQGKGGIKEWIESSQFMINSYNGQKEYPLLLHINPERHAEVKVGPWIHFSEGGDPILVASKCFDTVIREEIFDLRNLTEEQKALMVISYLLKLPDSIQCLCRQNSEFRLPFNLVWGGKGDAHAFSLKPKEVLDKLTTQTAPQILDELKRESVRYYQEPLGKEGLQAVFEGMRRNIPKDRSAVKYALSNDKLLDARSLSELWKILAKELHAIGAESMDRTILEALLITALPSSSQAGNIPYLNLGDSNWMKESNFGYIVSIDNAQLLPVFIAPDFSSIRLMGNSKLMQTMTPLPYTTRWLKF